MDYQPLWFPHTGIACLLVIMLSVNVQGSILLLILGTLALLEIGLTSQLLVGFSLLPIGLALHRNS